MLTSCLHEPITPSQVIIAMDSMLAKYMGMTQPTGHLGTHDGGMYSCSAENGVLTTPLVMNWFTAVRKTSLSSSMMQTSLCQPSQV